MEALSNAMSETSELLGKQAAEMFNSICFSKVTQLNQKSLYQKTLEWVAAIVRQEPLAVLIILAGCIAIVLDYYAI